MKLTLSSGTSIIIPKWKPLFSLKLVEDNQNIFLKDIQVNIPICIIYLVYSMIVDSLQKL